MLVFLMVSTNTIMPLSDVALRQAKPQDKPYKLTDGTGLFVLVNHVGKYWRFNYRFEGRQKTASYGVYPEVPLTLARERHSQAKKMLAQGIDPMAERRADKESAHLTFKVVAQKWHGHWLGDKTSKHAADVWKRLEADIFPMLGHLPVADLTAAKVRDAVKAIEKRGALDIAKRQLEKCGQIMRYAVSHDMVERNPVADIKPSDILPARKKRHHMRLEAKDLPQLLQDMDGYVGAAHTRLAMKLMALTFVRTSELIGARWEEIDLEAKRWTIPAERMKVKTSGHIVPLSRQAVEVLEELQGIAYSREYVFPADTGKPKHMSNNTILYALYRMGYKGKMTGHGFRGMASTILHEQQWPHEHIELQLAHMERNEVSAAYNFAQYLPARAKMMQAWADHLDAIMVPNVVALKTA